MSVPIFLSTLYGNLLLKCLTADKLKKQYDEEKQIVR